jgi:hypothetical protein
MGVDAIEGEGKIKIKVIAQYIPPCYNKAWGCEDEFSRTRPSYLFRRGSR